MSGRSRVYSRGPWLLAVLEIGHAAVPLAAQVAIDGGREPTNPYKYTWTLTNHGSKNITYLEIPHFLGVGFEAPPHWTYEITEQVVEGKPVTTGVVRTRPQSPWYALRPGQSAEFSLTVAVVANPPAPRSGTVKIGFADDTVDTIAGVEVPCPVPWLQRHALLLELGAMFALFLLVQALRSRRKKKRDLAPTPASAG